jgi:putative ABC transport system ATP-binding protein
VTVDGVELDLLSERGQRKVRREEVGYLFQRPSENFVSYMTVGQHLALMTPDVGHGDRALAHLGILSRKDHLAEELSGGEQQRAAVAQVISGPPRLIIADEPTAELDSATRASLISLVTTLRDEGWTFVIGTHDDELVKAADHVVELDHGRLKQAARARRTPYSNESTQTRYWRPPPFSPTVSPRAAVRRGEPEPGAPILDLIDVEKTYHRGDEVVHALHDVNLTFRTRSFTGIMGRSGSGKTTLLNVVGGWEQPDSGAIKWADDGPNGAVPAWEDLAMVPQRLGLLDEFTVEENVLYPARLTGRVDEVRERLALLIESLGLEGLTARLPWELSIGQQQRVAIARAVILRPRVLLADEPTGHQDTANGEAVFDVLQETAENGTCCVVATHNEVFAKRFDTVIKMTDGRTIPPGEP